MSGTLNGGKAAATTNKKRHGADFYARIGAIGGRNSNNGGFASYQFCNCDLIEEVHYKQQCAGKKGGRISKRRKSDG
jgi:hypothetical protein